jgi:hypothetical protein
MNEYIAAYTQGEMKNMVPLDSEKLKMVIASVISVEKELVEALVSMSNNDRELARRFIRTVGQ